MKKPYRAVVTGHILDECLLQLSKKASASDPPELVLRLHARRGAISCRNKIMKGILNLNSRKVCYTLVCFAPVLPTPLEAMREAEPGIITPRHSEATRSRSICDHFWYNSLQNISACVIE